MTNCIEFMIVNETNYTKILTSPIIFIYHLFNK